MKNVLFIIPDNYQDDNNFPLGVGYLSSVLHNEGANVSVYCMDVFHHSLRDIEIYLSNNHFDLIGVGFLAPRFEETIVDLCAVINKFKSDALFVLGGHGVSPIPEYILDRTKADMAAIGESEESILEIYNEINPSDINGIAFRKNEKIIVNERRKPIKDLDSIPFPLWDIFPIEEYSQGYKYIGCDDNDRLISILTSRGCTGRCGFCFRNEKGIRFRSIPNVIQEIKLLHKLYGINYFKIHDECFVLSEKRLQDFVDSINKLDFEIKYSCDCISNRLTEEIAILLKQSGCQLLNIGFESMDAEVLKSIPKGTTIEDNINAAKLCKKYNINMGMNMIWNCPKDNAETLTEDVKFLKSYNTYAQVRTIKPMTPYPGSPFYYQAILNGSLRDADDFFSRFKNLDLVTVNFMDMSTKDAHKLLFGANRDLIIDHFKHTTGKSIDTENLVEQFRKLYFEENFSFRGGRFYSNDKKY